ncbi:MAG TPA: patatin-like phospholipase family protein [Spirochaetota bacterium]|nr:patatin-like phospholipase family protein [Spirochaetota bacterium]
MKTGNTVFRAGARAYAAIQEQGLSPDMVSVMAGAAGGPKWLMLSNFDRVLSKYLFGGRKDPVLLIGSSIGAWRFAALSRENPLAAIDTFEETYINQHYSSKPDIEEVTRESFRIMDSFLGGTGIEEALGNTRSRICMITVKSRGPAATDARVPLGASMACAALCNAVSRRGMKLFFSRTLFHDSRVTPPVIDGRGFSTRHIPLSSENFRSALMASGSIPMVMEGIHDIPGAPEGTYRDGGLIDYHLDLPFPGPGDSIVLFPHYVDRIIPGWFDKPLKWRKPRPAHMDRVLLVAPSPEFVATLPLGKIPDRNDFYLFNGRDRERIKYWRTAVRECERLADEFHEAVTTGKIRDLVEPL